MMKFEYNSDCTFEERVELVTKEIMEEYPNISLECAQNAAVIDDPIDDKINNNHIFKRYYNVLLTLDKKDPIFNQVCNDLLRIYQSGISDNKLICLMDELMKYVNNRRSTMPLLSEFYE